MMNGNTTKSYLVPKSLEEIYSHVTYIIFNENENNMAETIFVNAEKSYFMVHVNTEKQTLIILSLHLHKAFPISASYIEDLSFSLIELQNDYNHRLFKEQKDLRKQNLNTATSIWQFLRFQQKLFSLV